MLPPDSAPGPDDDASDLASDAPPGQSPERAFAEASTRALTAPSDDPDRTADRPHEPDQDWDSAPPERLGKYKVEVHVGHGGMGVVWRATDPDLNRTVAIKTLAEHLTHSRTARQRFLREARAAAAISHPNVLTIHSVEEQDQTPFIVMEFVSGGSLREFVATRGKLPPLQVIQLSCQIAQGLAAAHAQGVIHRDVKPGNVMLHPGGTRVRLADFGLARAAFDNSDLTSHDQALGTPAYMAPEQLRAEKVDPRADLFGLGCVMYYMLTGSSPFQGRTPGETIHRILGSPHRPLSEVEPGVPPLLAEIVDRLLQKNPDDRYQSAAEVASLLERLLQQLNQAATDEISALLAGSSSADLAPAPAPAMTMTPAGRSRWGALTTLTVVVLAGLAGYAWKSGWLTTAPASQGAVLPATLLEPSRGPALLTVARTGDAQFRDLQAALDQARDGDTVRVLDAARYEVNLQIEARQRLTLESIAGAELYPASAEANLLEARGCQQFVLRGFRLTTLRNHHAVLLSGCEGGALDRLRIVQEGARSVAAIQLLDCNPAPTAAPLRVQDCVVDSRSTGQCLWVSAKPNGIWNLEVERNRFHGPGTGTLGVLITGGGSARIRNNEFTGGYVAWNMNLLKPTGEPAAPSRIEIVNNTFCNCRAWLGLMSTDPEAMPFTLQNNLLLNCSSVEASESQRQGVARKCQLGGNIWERAPPAAGSTDLLGDWARFETAVTVLSRDLNAPDYLKLPADSPLRAAGVGASGPTRVGAEF